MSEAKETAQTNQGDNKKSDSETKSLPKLSTYPSYLSVPGIQKNGGIELVKGTICKEIMRHHEQKQTHEAIASSISTKHVTNIIEGERPYTVQEIKAITDACEELGLKAGTPLEANWEDEVIEEWWKDEDKRRYGQVDKTVTGMDIQGWWTAKENPGFICNRWRDADIGEVGSGLRSMSPN